MGTTNLPKPPTNWTKGGTAWAAEVKRQVDALSARAFQKGSDVVLGTDSRVVVTSPNGSQFLLTLSDTGTFSATPIADAVSSTPAPPPPPPAPPPPPLPPPPPPPSVAPFYPFGSYLDLFVDTLARPFYPNGTIITNTTRTEQETWVKTHYDAWKAARVVDAPSTPGGKAVLIDSLTLTQATAMGFGMLIAVAMAGYDANAQTLFDSLLRTVRNHPATAIGATKLMEWRILPDGTSGGGGTASLDGNMDIILALLMADRQWGASNTTFNYRSEAAATILELKTLNFFRIDGTPQGQSAAHVCRVSDFMIGHFRAFARATNDSFWVDAAIPRCLTLMELMQQNFSAAAGLIPDFIVNTDGSLNGQINPTTGLVYNGPTPSPGGFVEGPDEDKFFNSNVRLGWRLFSDYYSSGDLRVKGILDKLVAFIRTKTNNSPVWSAQGAGVANGYRLDGSAMSFTTPEIRGTAGFMLAGMDNSANQLWVNDCWTWLSNNWVTPPVFYTSEMHLLSAIVATCNWWNPTASGVALPPPPLPAPPPPPPPPADVLPSKIVGCYYVGWDESARITAVPTSFNLIYLFNAVPDANANVRWPYGPNPAAGSFNPTPAEVQICRGRGQKILLTLGGSGFAFAFQNRVNSQNCVNSLRVLIDQFGGVDGVDFNTFEGTGATDPLELIWIAQQLKATYGPNFAITAPPAGFKTGGAAVNDIAASSGVDLNLMGALKDAGMLTYAGPQYYDWDFYNLPGSISGINDQWVQRLGAEHVVVGLSANYPAGPSLADCEREWDVCIARHPTQRGVFAWNAQLNIAGGNVWGTAMAARVGAPAAAPPPAPAPGPSPGVPVVAVSRHPDAFLLTGAPNMTSTLRGYYVDSSPQVTSIVEGSPPNNFMQQIGRSLVTNGGLVDLRLDWFWPDPPPAGTAEIKAYPCVIYGGRPGYRSPDHMPAWEKFIKLPDGVTDATDKNGTATTNAADGTISDVNLSTVQTIPGMTPGCALPLQLPLTGSIVVEFDWSFNGTPTGMGQLVFDIWLQRQPDIGFGFSASSISHEIMIAIANWGGYGSHASVPGGRNPSWFDHQAPDVGGRPYWVYATKNNPRNDITGVVDGGSYPGLRYNFGPLNGSFTNPETGQPAIGWKMLAFVPQPDPIDAGAGVNVGGHYSVDLVPIINYLRTRFDSRGVQWLQGNEFLNDIELGCEIVSGGGDVTIYNYSVTRTP